MMRNLRFLSLLVLLVFASGIYAVPPPRGIDPLEAKRKARIDKIKRERPGEILSTAIYESVRRLAMEALPASTNAPP